MAATCPNGFDERTLREQVRIMYERVAREPGGSFHFHRGPGYAEKYLRYDVEDLDHVPYVSAARFAGVGNPHRVGPIRPGEIVLDHACGAGMDLIIAARKVGSTGRAIGVDMTPTMLDCARRGVDEAAMSSWVELHLGLYEQLPTDDETVDVVISNGVLNLAPDKRRVLSEIARVLKPGGRAYIADVVVQRELTLAARQDPELWAACVGGALPEPELAELTAEAGLIDGAITERFECFRDTSAEAKVSKDLRVGAVNFYARKP